MFRWGGIALVMPASRFLRYIPEDPMIGPDVRGVQQRLRKLGYYQGPLDGQFGRGTSDAVIAFQARRGLTPDGVVGPATYAALGSDASPQAVSEERVSITIDTEKLKMYLRRNGRIQRVYDVAAGAPDTPTPIGRWVIVEKTVNPGGPFGSRWMRLNVPWGGYGIHGTDVESSIGGPVSHGCVRMRNRDVEDLYNLVPIGTVVNIIGQIFTGRMLFPDEASGPDVRAVQELLRVLGYYQGDPDGVYAGATVQAVRELQAQFGLPADGIVGPNTYDALLKAFDQERGSVQP